MDPDHLIETRSQDSAWGNQDSGASLRWSGPALLRALQTVSSHFEPHVPSINALNVFPVPDGDTGTNMYLTIQAAVREAQRSRDDTKPSAGEVMARAAHGALMGARGNSGVILYQIFAGLAEGGQGADEIDGQRLAAGLRRATDLAYRAVLTPVEGTILTVIRAAAEAAEATVRADPSVVAVLDAAFADAAEALRRTPDLLDILRQAGVVDAGGQGLVTILNILRQFARGGVAEIAPLGDPSAIQVARSMAFLDQADVVHGIDEYGYCTNFLITAPSIPLAEFRSLIVALGTSAVVVGDERAIKVHIHTDHPGTILEVALGYGELQQIRIDNMSVQTRQLLTERAESSALGRGQSEVDEAGLSIVVVASGEGLAGALRGMGASTIVPGGPTFNPSTEDILTAAEASPRQEVIILPNDPNVIPTATQVERLTGKTVRVVPSRSIPQGISALAAFNFDASLDDNVRAMTEALGYVRSLALARASRDAEIEGIHVQTGQFIGLLDGTLRAAHDDPVTVALELLAEAEPEEAELVTIFIGEPATDGLDQQVAAAIESAYPHLTVELSAGGQPHYDLIVSLE